MCTQNAEELCSLQTNNCLDLTVMSGWRIISARQQAVTSRPVKARTWEIYTLKDWRRTVSTKTEAMWQTKYRYIPEIWIFNKAAKMIPVFSHF